MNINLHLQVGWQIFESDHHASCSFLDEVHRKYFSLKMTGEESITRPSVYGGRRTCMVPRRGKLHQVCAKYSTVGLHQHRVAASGSNALKWENKVNMKSGDD